MLASNKIKSIAEIGKILSAKQKDGQRVVHCHGEFDLLHLGHMRYFQAAKKSGDILLVTLTADRFIAKGPGRPVFSEQFRAEAIANLEFVDFVAINEWATAEETIKRLKPNVYAKGSEYQHKKDVTGRLELEKNLVESLGGKFIFTDEIIFSSSKLLNNNFDVFSKKSKAFLQELSEVLSALETIEDLEKRTAELKVLIIGESHLEEHHICNPGEDSSGFKSVSKFQQSNGTRLGYEVIKNYCENTDYISTVPTAENLNERAFKDCAAERKSRYWDEQTGYCLFDVEEAGPLSDILAVQNSNKVLLDKLVGDYDCILVFDQNRGTITLDLIDDLKKRCETLYLSHSPMSSKEYQEYRVMNRGVETTSRLMNIKRWEWIEYELNNKQTKIPWFTDKKQMQFPMDVESGVFSLVAIAQCINMNGESIGFLGNAMGAFLGDLSEKPLSFDRMLFNKFLIALLNR
jgi:rfaE bifunctional protein nucleotidyltransferase chain/domain